MAQWYISVNGRQMGPCEDEQIAQLIRSAQIGLGDMVWREGMAQWAPVGRVGELQNLATGIPATHAGSAPTLAYASALPPAFIAPEPDSGPFLKLGKRVSVGDSVWIGPVVASPKAIYIVRVRKQMNRAAAGVAVGAVGGLVGGLLVAAMAPTGRNEIRSCTFGELPDDVQAALRVVSRRCKDNLDAVVLRRNTVARVSIGSINNLVSVRVGADQFKIEIGLFRNGSIKRFFSDNGWIPNTDLTPSIAPQQGPGYGLSQGQGANTGPSTGMRILSAAIAIAIFVVIIILRVGAILHRR